MDLVKVYILVSVHEVWCVANSPSFSNEQFVMLGSAIEDGWVVIINFVYSSLFTDVVEKRAV